MTDYTFTKSLTLHFFAIQAVVHVRNIELRLQGMINIKGKGFSISLSPEGQANNLILEATNVDNLCQMYVGWGPFM